MTDIKPIDRMNPTERARALPPAAQGKTNILLLTTVRCQLKCPYCQWHFKGDAGGGTLTMAGGAEWKIGQELTANEWLKCLERFAPYHVEITGGEPTLHGGLKDFVAGMPEGCTWAITTNGLEMPFTEDELPNCLGYAVSFHLPYAKVDNRFVARVCSNATNLLRRGIKNFKFSMVITPKLIDAAEQFTREIVRWGYVLHYNQAALVDGLDWDEHPDVVERLNLLTGGNLIKYPLTWDEFPTFKRCTAGDSKYFFLMPDGNVLRCHSQIYWKDSKPIGHISDWQPTEGMKPCGKPHLWVCDDRATEKE